MIRQILMALSDKHTGRQADIQAIGIAWMKVSKLVYDLNVMCLLSLSSVASTLRLLNSLTFLFVCLLICLSSSVRESARWDIIISQNDKSAFLTRFLPPITSLPPSPILCPPSLFDPLSTLQLVTFICNGFRFLWWRLQLKLAGSPSCVSDDCTPH